MISFNIFSAPVAHALGYTLLYSFWQAFIVFICLRIILKCFSHAAANFKYAISFFAHLSIAAWFVITFFQQLFIQQNLHASEKMMLQSVPYTTFNSSTIATSHGLSFSLSFLNNYMPWLAAFYLLGIMWCGTRLIINYYQTIFLKTKGLSELDIVWQNHVQRLAAKMEIYQGLRIFISQKINTPAMIGFLKPVILLPVAAISNLSPYQIEAILLHELAHIRRNDYLFNLIQSVVDTILFFNPFARQISKNIRDEREKCCDEMVLQLSDPYHYAGALLALEECRQHSSLVMTATGKRSQLLYRIKNIMEMQNKKINLRQKLIALLIVAAGTISVAWLTPKENKTVYPAKETAAAKAVLSFPIINQAQSFLLTDTMPFYTSTQTQMMQPPLPPTPGQPIFAAIPLPPDPPLPPLPPIPPMDSIPSPDSSFNFNFNFNYDSSFAKDYAKKLQQYFNSDEWKQQQKAIQEKTAAMQKYFQSKEWKQQQELIQKNAAAIKKYFNSPEWKKQQEAIKKNAQKMQEYFNSDAWKKQQQEIQKYGDSIKSYFNSDAWKRQQENLQKALAKNKQFFESAEWKNQQTELKKIMEENKKMFNSPGWKKQQEALRKSMEQNKKFFESAQWKQQQQQLNMLMDKVRQQQQKVLQEALQQRKAGRDMEMDSTKQALQLLQQTQQQKENAIKDSTQL